MKKTLTDNDIKKINKRICNGESVDLVTEEYGISYQAYYQRVKNIPELQTKKEAKKAAILQNIDNLNTISNIPELAAFLNLSVDNILALYRDDYSTQDNNKRLNYLKNKSPERFQDAVVKIILKYYKITPVNLIKLLKKNK